MVHFLPHFCDRLVFLCLLINMADFCHVVIRIMLDMCIFRNCDILIFVLHHRRWWSKKASFYTQEVRHSQKKKSGKKPPTGKHKKQLVLHEWLQLRYIREQGVTILTFVFLYFLGSLSGFSVFCWSAVSELTLGSVTTFTANSDQLSLLTSWGWTTSPPHYFLTLLCIAGLNI